MGEVQAPGKTLQHRPQMQPADDPRVMAMTSHNTEDCLNAPEAGDFFDNKGRTEDIKTGIGAYDKSKQNGKP